MSPTVETPVGFADAGVTERQRGIVRGIAIAMLALASAGIAFGRALGPVVPSVLATLMGAVIVTDIFSASLLLHEFLESRLASRAIVGAGYLFSGLIVVGYLLTFPQVFSPTGSFGANAQTAIALWCIWHAFFPIAIIAAVVAGDRAWRVAPASAWKVLGAIVLACALAVVALVYLLSRCSSALPIFIDGSGGFTPTLVRGPTLAIFALNFFALIALARSRVTSAVGLWLQIAVLALLLETILAVISVRYSGVWYISKVFAVTSSSVMLAVFMSEIARVSKALSRANRELEAVSEHVTRHDAVTDLPNRAQLEERLHEAVIRGQERRQRTGVLHVNLDRFRTVNEAVGLAAGDDLLREVARRLSATIRSEDFIACTGGGDFVILFADFELMDDIVVLAHAVLESLRVPLAAGEHRIFPSASIGVSICPDDAGNTQALLGAATAALGLAKKQGGNDVRFYRAAMHDSAVEWIEAESDLRAALEQRQFRVFYQPIVDVASGETISAEALLRWQHPLRGLIGPDAFIPIAEQSGLMIPIGAWVLDEVTAQMRRWQDRGLDVPVAVNVSVSEFRDPAFFERLSAALCRHLIKPEMLTIEVTESLAIDSAERTQQTLARCRELGVGISLDDFGTSHACLANVKRLPITTLKIDKLFIRELTKDRTDAAIVSAILSFAKGLELESVAEGIETAEQLRWLREAGCKYGQGYFFARPLPAEDFESRLRTECRRSA